jgi:hypothetical protein
VRHDADDHRLESTPLCGERDALAMIAARRGNHAVHLGVPQDQALDLERQAIGPPIRSPRPILRPFKPAALVAGEDLVAGLAGNIELPSADREAGNIVAQLIGASGFAAVRVGGIDQSIRIEVFGDLHELGKLGKLVTAKEAAALV